MLKKHDFAPMSIGLKKNQLVSSSITLVDLAEEMFALIERGKDCKLDF